MSLKVLCFGDHQFASKVVATIRSEERQVDPQEQIIVDNVQVCGRQFLIFCINNPELISSQATGTTAILYFLDVNMPIFQQKQLLFDVLSQRKQFDSLPVIIGFDKDQYLQIKDIVNSFELFKVKDRASMIKQINLNDKQTIEEVFNWIQNQNEFNKTRTFDAPPKIVKMKPKYRESESDATEKKYDQIIRDKKLKGMDITKHEQAYIQGQKERIKNENMEKQLANFNKNKKKMSPYDIKATPNPKIQANLHFFLKDPKVQKSQEVNIKIQTDEFKDLPKPKPYVAKKTGINAATQIQPTQLFDFDKEVRPILQILTTRALEEAALEIEENEECLKIAKYKSTYNERMKKQKKHQDDSIEAEMQAIREKQRILQFARKKDSNRKNLAKKQSYYSLANNFLEGIYKSAAVTLYNKNYYPDQFEHHLKTDYIPDVLELAMKSYDRILEKEKSLCNTFGQACIKPIVQAKQAPKAARLQEKKERQMRKLNSGDKVKFIHIHYQHTQRKFSSFAKYLSKQLDGSLEQYVRTREEQIQEFEDKAQGGQIEESEVTKIKNKDDQSFAQNHHEFLINTQNRICVSATENKFEQPKNPNSVIVGIHCFNSEGDLVSTVQSSQKENTCKFVRCVNNLRQRKSPINMDNGLVINLEEVPDNVCSLVFYTKINNVGSYIGENQAKAIKNAAYGIEFYQKAIPIHKQNFGQNIKWEQLPKSGGGEGDDGNQLPKKTEFMMIFSYHLRRKIKEFWHYEAINTATKLFEDKDESEVCDKVANFYKQSLQIFKVEEEIRKNTPKSPERGSKRKSRKNLEQKEKTPRRVELGIQSRILKEVQVGLKDNWSLIFNKLGDQVIDWKQFIENSPDGWYLSFRGEKLENVNQIKKYRRVGDIELKKVEPVIEEKVDEVAEQQEENKADDQ